VKIGLQIGGHVAARAIQSLSKAAGHELMMFDSTTIDSLTCQTLEALVIAGPTPVATFKHWLAVVPQGCQIVYISGHHSLPAPPALVPWSADSFNVTGELLPGQHQLQVARDAERLLLLQSTRSNWTLLRPAIVEGPSDSDPKHSRWFVERLLAGGPVCLPDGDEQAYRHVSTRDLANAVLAVLGQPRAHRRVLHVCSDAVLCASTHARAIAEALGCKLDLRFVPESQWDQAELVRPMAGTSGSALMLPSPLLRELGWVPVPSGRFLRNLAKELAEQPRRLDADTRARELALVTHSQHASAGIPVIRKDPTLDITTHLAANVTVEPIFPNWQRVAIALGEEVERTATALISAGIGRQLCGPQLLMHQNGQQPMYALLLGPISQQIAARPSALIPTPSHLGLQALLAPALARLLQAWPKEAPEGEVWVLGRGIEALLAYWLAQDAGRAVKLLGLATELAPGPDLPHIEALSHSLLGQPAIVLNVSAAPEGESIATQKLPRNGIVITPFMPAVPYQRSRLTVLPDFAEPIFVEAAIERLLLWRDRLAKHQWLHPIRTCHLSTAWASPALQLAALTDSEDIL